MNDGIALIVNPDGTFEVRRLNYGSQRQVSWSESLADALSQAALVLGYPLVIPMSGPGTAT